MQHLLNTFSRVFSPSLRSPDASATFSIASLIASYSCSVITLSPDLLWVMLSSSLYLAAQISRHCSTRGFKCQMAVQAHTGPWLYRPSRSHSGDGEKAFLSGPQEVSPRERERPY